MHANNNRTAIKRISCQSGKANRIRNIFTILAIFLTTYMIATIFSVGVSYAQNYSVMLTRLQGTSASIFLENSSQEQYREIKSLVNEETVGVRISAGIIPLVNKYGDNLDIPLTFCDQTEWREHYTPAISEINGSYPEEINEIMLSREALLQLGITEPKEGIELSLTVSTNEGEEKVTFILSGWFTNYKDYGSSGVAAGLISRKFYEKYHFSLEEDGYLSISAQVNQQEAVLTILMEHVTLKTGQEFIHNFNTSEDAAGTTLFVLLIVGMLCLFIVLSGYLLIYNVIYISMFNHRYF